MNQSSPTPDLAARYPSASPSRLQSLTLAQAAGVSSSTLDRLASAQLLARNATAYRFYLGTWEVEHVQVGDATWTIAN